MKNKNLAVTLILFIGITLTAGFAAYLIGMHTIWDMKQSLLHDNKKQQPGTGIKGSAEPQTTSDTSGADPSSTNNAEGNSSSKNTDSQEKSYLFDIYSEKDNIEEAVKEIAFKYFEDVKDWYNEKYVKEGVDQRMENARLTHVSEHPGVNGCGSYDNLVEGGTLSVYDIEFELKPKYPEKFIPEMVIETLQESGWVLMEGRILLIYHEEDKIDAPYYLAKVILFDEFLMGKPDEQVLSEIVKNQILQLKLLKRGD